MRWWWWCCCSHYLRQFTQFTAVHVQNTYRKSEAIFLNQPTHRFGGWFHFDISHSIHSYPSTWQHSLCGWSCIGRTKNGWNLLKIDKSHLVSLRLRHFHFFFVFCFSIGNFYNFICFCSFFFRSHSIAHFYFHSRQSNFISSNRMEFEIFIFSFQFHIICVRCVNGKWPKKGKESNVSELDDIK